MRNLYSFTLVVLTLTLSVNCLAQPYWGTIFIESDIITPADPSTYQSATYKGQGNRVVYDRRTASWVTINAYLFDVVWDDGLTSEAQVNPEFGTVENAAGEAEKYGWAIGQLPTCLRVDVKAIWIHKGTEAFGGGNNSILIHTGQSALYERDGILEETLVHEASHTSLDAAHASGSGWLAAQSLDNTFISSYAKDNPTREDIAESFLTWLAIRHRANRISQQNYQTITSTIPNRIAYFDNQHFDLYPMADPVTSVAESVSNELSVYPNPSADFIIVTGAPETAFELVEMYSGDGRKVLNSAITSATNKIDISMLDKGTYLLIVTSGDGRRYSQKCIKY